MTDLKTRVYKAFMLLEDADNVYRTKYYIIKQKIVVVDDIPGTALLLSEDTFFKRNTQRDEEYEILFEARGKKINGKRITSAMCTRKYAD